MKRIIIIVLITSLLFTLLGCNNKMNNSNEEYDDLIVNYKNLKTENELLKEQCNDLLVNYEALQIDSELLNQKLDESNINFNLLQIENESLNEKNNDLQSSLEKTNEALFDATEILVLKKDELIVLKNELSLLNEEYTKSIKQKIENENYVETLVSPNESTYIYLFNENGTYQYYFYDVTLDIVVRKLEVIPQNINGDIDGSWISETEYVVYYLTKTYNSSTYQFEYLSIDTAISKQSFYTHKHDYRYNSFYLEYVQFDELEDKFFIENGLVYRVEKNNLILINNEQNLMYGLTLSPDKQYTIYPSGSDLDKYIFYMTLYRMSDGMQVVYKIPTVYSNSLMGYSWRDNENFRIVTHVNPSTSEEHYVNITTSEITEDFSQSPNSETSEAEKVYRTETTHFDSQTIETIRLGEHVIYESENASKNVYNVIKSNTSDLVAFLEDDKYVKEMVYGHIDVENYKLNNITRVPIGDAKGQMKLTEDDQIIFDFNTQIYTYDFTTQTYSVADKDYGIASNKDLYMAYYIDKISCLINTPYISYIQYNLEDVRFFQ